MIGMDGYAWGLAYGKKLNDRHFDKEAGTIELRLRRKREQGDIEHPLHLGMIKSTNAMVQEIRDIAAGKLQPRERTLSKPRDHLLRIDHFRAAVRAAQLQLSEGKTEVGFTSLPHNVPPRHMCSSSGVKIVPAGEGFESEVQALKRELEPIQKRGDIEQPTRRAGPSSLPSKCRRAPTISRAPGRAAARSATAEARTCRRPKMRLRRDKARRNPGMRSGGLQGGGVPRLRQRRLRNSRFSGRLRLATSVAREHASAAWRATFPTAEGRSIAFWVKQTGNCCAHCEWRSSASKFARGFFLAWPFSRRTQTE